MFWHYPSLGGQVREWSEAVRTTAAAVSKTKAKAKAKGRGTHRTRSPSPAAGVAGKS